MKKLLKRFTSSKKACDKDDSSDVSGSKSSKSTSKSTNSDNTASADSKTTMRRLSTDSSTPLNQSCEQPRADALPAPSNPREKEMIALASKFFQLMNQHDLDEMANMIAPSFENIFGEIHLAWDSLRPELEGMHQSFPDFGFVIHQQPYLATNDSVEMKVNAFGTHTGKPYAFGPYEPLPAKGTKVKNDIELVKFTYEEDPETRDLKIKCVDIIAVSGDMHGPPGIYTQCGGFPLV